MATSKIKGKKMEYDGTISFPWTCTKDGFLIVRAKTTTSGAYYLYIKDQTANINVSQRYIHSTASGTWFTDMFPVVQGHEYKVDAISGATIDSVYHYALD